MYYNYGINHSYLIIQKRGWFDFWKAVLILPIAYNKKVI